MGDVLNTTGAARGFEFWVYVPDYADFEKRFSTCAQDLEVFCALEHCQVKIFLGSANGLPSAMRLAFEYREHYTSVFTCRPLLGLAFVEPLLRRTSMDDESDYAKPTKEGWRLTEPSEWSPLERQFLMALRHSGAEAA